MKKFSKTLCILLTAVLLFAGCSGGQAEINDTEEEKPSVKRIDFESHFYVDYFFTVAQERDVPPYYREDTGYLTFAEGISDPIRGLLPILLDMGEGRVKAMDEAGIDVSVLSFSVGAELFDAEESIEICRRANDALYEITQKYPGRFLGTAILPVKDVAAAVAELERCVKELGFVGWHTHSNFGTYNELDDEIFRPIFQKAAELGIFVSLHPATPLDKRLQGYGYPLYGAAFGYTVDTATTTLRLIYSGLFDEFPELTMILGHLGEAFPFLIQRIDNRAYLFGTELIKNVQKPSYYFQNNILVTTSGNSSEAAFNCTLDVFGIDRILFASDYPFENAADAVSFIDGLPLSEDERAAIYYKNAAEKLDIH